MSLEHSPARQRRASASTPSKNAPTYRALYKVPEAADELAVCRRTIYELVARKQLTAIKVLGATRITGESMKALVERAPKLKAAPSKYEYRGAARCRARA